MSQESQPSARRFHYAWVVLTVGTLITFGALGLARFGYSLLLPAMQTGLGLSNTGAGGLATANLTGYLALSLIGGALAARFGPRLVASLGLACAGVGMFFTGLANTLGVAMLFRAITGLGSGASNVPIMGLMSAWFSPRKRGLASGIAVAGSSLGLIIAGPLVPRVLEAFPEDGWRLSWYLFGGMALLLALLGAVTLRDDPSEVGLSPFGESRTGFSQAGGANKALQWGQVYGSFAVWHLGAVYAAFGFSYIIYMTFFVRYLVGELGYTRTAAGDLFMLMGWFSLACGLIWGGLSDRIGRRAALIIVYLIHALAYSLFVLWPATPGVTLSAVLFGLSAWSIPAIMAAVCGDVVGSRLAPAALGFVTLFFGIGQALGPSAAGALADARGSFKEALLLAAGTSLLGAAGAWLLKPVQAETEAATLDATPGPVIK